MHLTHLVVTSLAGLAAGAGISVNAGCATQMGTKSVKPVPTVASSTTTTYTTIYTTRFAGKTVTVTPKPVTKTITRSITSSTTTMAVPKTSTVSLRTTKLVTSSVTLAVSTVSKTSISVIETSITSTTTVPTAAGFTPVHDSLDQATMAGNIKGNSVEKRATTLFPQKVDCRTTTFMPATITVTKAPTKTASGSTKTVTKTTTVKKVSTKVPAAVTVKKTSTTTSIVQKTITPSPVTMSTTTTTTTTVDLPGPTVYDACADNNFADSLPNGDNFYQLETGSGVTGTGAGVTSPYECCTICFSTEGCAASYVQYGACILLKLADGSSCSAESPCSGSVSHHRVVLTATGATLINGPALQWKTFT